MFMSSQAISERPESNWFALRVRSRHEKRVAELLTRTGVDCFLPLQHVRRRWSQRWTELDLPLFPGYLFACFERERWTRVVNVPGVVDAVRFGKVLAPVDIEELAALRIVQGARCELEPCPYFPTGQRIQIAGGPLAGLSGTVTEDQGRSQLVLSVTLLQRSVRVKIERDSLELVRSAA
ncbi:MAG TPA: UpxY family transcription antiterminator [Bryobacteraceae bacterium]|jgi:transcription antitermination factor NusG|nr:UpxY family transcription antiterminator [Bryobacteraceae bacterium]